MAGNEEVIRDLYADAESRVPDIEKSVSMFSDEGNMWDMATGIKFRGQAIW